MGESVPKNLTVEEENKVTELKVTDENGRTIEEERLEKGAEEGCELTMRKEKLRAHHRHYSDPGLKRRTRNRLSKNKKLSKSFTGFKQENKKAVRRRCSTPESSTGKR